MKQTDNDIINLMFVRTTVDIPEPLHAALRQRADSAGTSIRSLIVFAIEQACNKPRTGAMSPVRSRRPPESSGLHSRATKILMISFFPDLNIWIALSLRTHPHYGAAWDWLRSAGPEARLIFSRYAHLGYLRLLINPAVMGENTFTTGEAWAM